jgi:hypothetical protein
LYSKVSFSLGAPPQVSGIKPPNIKTNTKLYRELEIEELKIKYCAEKDDEVS